MRDRGFTTGDDFAITFPKHVGCRLLELLENSWAIYCGYNASSVWNCGYWISVEVFVKSCHFTSEPSRKASLTTVALAGCSIPSLPFDLLMVGARVFAGVRYHSVGLRGLSASASSPDLPSPKSRLSKNIIQYPHPLIFATLRCHRKPCVTQELNPFFPSGSGNFLRISTVKQHSLAV
jgi:hypothetical protein